VSVTILDRRRTARFPGFPRVRAGDVWFAIHIRFSNGGDSSQTFSPADVTLQADSGSQQKPDSPAVLTSQNLPVGASHTGWIGFDVPAKARAFTLRWSDGGLLSPPALVERYVRV
jgi:hypothetical protein